jgi:hypothetical protein
MAFTAKGQSDNNDLGIPAGEHLVEIISATLIRSAQKGTPGIKMRFQDSKKRIADGTLWLTEKGIGFMESAMASIGKPVKIGEEFDPQPDDFLGRSAKIEVKKNENGFSELASWLKPVRVKPEVDDLSDDEIPF